MIKITVPEDLGGELRVLPEDTYEASIQDIFYGMSKTSGAPKLTVKWVVQSEYSGKHGEDYVSTVGENVLEAYSLQPNALWKLNNLYKTTTGERLPQGDYQPEEFVDMVKNALIGAECLIDVMTDSSQGRERSVVANILPKQKKASSTVRRKK